jgi:nucleotide-binding universal stress UspA family protein
MTKSGKYLVYVSTSESSRVAMYFACKKAVKSGSSVELLNVISPSDMQNLFGVGSKMREEQRQDAEILVKSLGEAAFQYSGITPSTIIREGRINEEIINAALEDTNVNMVVAGISAQSNDEGSLINLLVEKLGDRLLVPLMLVPGNLTDLQIDELS